MYYEEKMINGVLYYRYSPSDRFTKATSGILNRRLCDLEDRIKFLQKEAAEAYQKGRADFRKQLAEEVVAQLTSLFG